MKSDKAVIEPITEIIFKHSGNHFLNAGIVALNYYLEEFKKNTDIDYIFNLSEFQLRIESKQLFKLLEDVYYYMGKEIYDTSGAKAREKIDKYYFKKEPFQAIPFAKMKTYGLAGLITNDPAAVTGKDGEKIKFNKLIHRDEEFAKQIAHFLYDNGKKLKFYSIVEGKLIENEKGANGKRLENRGGESEVFINSPYTKTTKIDILNDYFIEGDKTCYLTGEKYKKLVDNKCTSPFLSGLPNFDSNFSVIDKKISWKAMYLSRFCPKYVFYTYSGGLDNLMVYLINSDNLLSLNRLKERYLSLYKSEIQVINCNYLNNFNLYNFNISTEKFNIKKDLYFENENLFVLILSFYNLIIKKNQNIEFDDNENTLLQSLGLEIDKLPPLSITAFKAEKFSGTMRTDYYEEFDNFKFILRMIAYMEKKQLSIKDLFFDLKFIKGSDKKRGESYKIERMLRNKILGRILKNRSIVDNMENLFYKCYNAFFSEGYRFRNYKNISEFTYVYEQIIKYGGNTMDDNLQKRAINLGTSIGQGILKFQNQKEDSKVKRNNAEKARKYIIALKKAGTLEQFNSELIRLQNRYGISVSSEILEKVTRQNFNLIKQFAIISALNQLNSVLNPKKNDNYSKEGENHE